ncbi:hypothetical protein Misp02_10310 [Microtetraspora sp. NBRC 16547]|nr:hypothetical protein Misp02_10310 [Microtetraspora sp. NBRC 16547]
MPDWYAVDMPDSLSVPDTIIEIDAEYVGGVLAVNTAAEDIAMITDSTMNGQPLRASRT